MKLTILTPSFNREKTGIRNLWESLQNQTVKDFEWLVVDDGSTDNTKKLIQDLKAASDFNIRYIYKENGGKHTALNVGIATVQNELTFIVDSDDCLTPNAVETILLTHDKFEGHQNLCGYAFLRAFPDGAVNGKLFPEDNMEASYIDVRVNGDDTGADKAEVFYTERLKEFPFPEYPGEKFLGEDMIWFRMARKYNMVHVNKAIYVGNYMDDGLTLNRRKHNISSPLGCMNRAIEFLEPDLKFRYRVKGALQYIIYGKFAGISVRGLISSSNHKGLVILFSLPGVFIYQKWKRTV